MLLKALFTYLLVTAVLYLIGVTQSESVVMSLLCSVEYFFFFLLSYYLKAPAFCLFLLIFKISSEILGIGWGVESLKKYLLVDFKSG